MKNKTQISESYIHLSKQVNYQMKGRLGLNIIKALFFPPKSTDLDLLKSAYLKYTIIKMSY